MQKDAPSGTMSRNRQTYFYIHVLKNTYKLFRGAPQQSQRFSARHKQQGLSWREISRGGGVVGGANYDDGRPVTITDTAPRVCSAEFTVGRECMSYCKFLTSSPRLRAVNLPPPPPDFDGQRSAERRGRTDRGGCREGATLFFWGCFLDALKKTRICSSAERRW